MTRWACSTAAAVSAACFAAAFACDVATSSSFFAFRYNALAALAFAVSCFRVEFAAANFLAAASAALFLAASAIFAASISARVGFGFAMAGVDARVSPAMIARLMRRFLRRID